MLLSGSELRKQIKFLIESSSEEVTIVSAFVKTSIIEELSELLIGRKVTIYVRWKLIDLIRGVSDFETLYEVCAKQNYKLLYNQRLHAKMIIIDRSKAIIGSSNFTQSGFGGGHDNIEWNMAIHELKPVDYQRIITSLSSSDLVTPIILDNFKKALDVLPPILDLSEIENPRLELHAYPIDYFTVHQMKLPPFEPGSFDFENVNHREYLHSLGFITIPSDVVLVTAIKNSYYGQTILQKLHEQPKGRNGERRLRWGDVGYEDVNFFSANDGLHNLFLWLSKIDQNYSFYRNPNYPKGTCSLNCM
jgi:hypothetical protein